MSTRFTAVGDDEEEKPARPRGPPPTPRPETEPGTAEVEEGVVLCTGNLVEVGVVVLIVEV